jgi:hypothetical protein
MIKLILTPNGKLIKNLVKEINKYEKQKFWQA